MYWIEESTCDIVRTFWRLPQWLGARGIAPPCPPSLRTCTYRSLLKTVWFDFVAQKALLIFHFAVRIMTSPTLTNWSRGVYESRMISGNFWVTNFVTAASSNFWVESTVLRNVFHQLGSLHQIYLATSTTYRPVSGNISQQLRSVMKRSVMENVKIRCFRSNQKHQI